MFNDDMREETAADQKTAISTVKLSRQCSSPLQYIQSISTDRYSSASWRLVESVSKTIC